MMRGRRGSAAIELAIVAPLLLTLLGGVLDVGFGLQEAMLAQNAAEAGALYAATHGWDSAGIQAAVVAAAPARGITATPPPSRFCGCANASGIAATACGTRCSGGVAASYVSVGASLTHWRIVPFDFMPDTLTGRSVVRLP
jgi:Flp pilus assembly protein TadG